MSNRSIFLLCIMLCVMTVLWMLQVSPGASPISAQGPISTDDDKSTPRPPRSPVLVDDAAPDSPKSGIQSPQNPNLTFSYYYEAGSTLMPRDSATGRDYTGSGCSYTTSGTDRIMNVGLHLPNGSIIKYLRIYYNDTNATNNVRGYITRYDASTSTNDLVSVVSSGSGGAGTALSAEITHTVDTFGFAYVLIGWPDTNSSTVQVCGLRVAYYAPSIFGTLMPLITR